VMMFNVAVVLSSLYFMRPICPGVSSPPEELVYGKEMASSSWSDYAKNKICAIVLQPNMPLAGPSQRSWLTMSHTFPKASTLSEGVTSIEIFQLQCAQASGVSGPETLWRAIRAVDLETCTAGVAVALRCQ